MGVLRSPLVLVSGNVSQLPPGDFISGDTVIATAGSGLVGGGTDVNTFRFDVGLATAPSGLIFVGTKLALDGVAQRTADAALASGNLAIASGNSAQFTANQALASGNLGIASGNAAQVSANVALASGIAAQATANYFSFIAVDALASGNLAIASGNAAQVTANNALTSGNLAIASGNAAISLGLNALASGNLGIASGNAAQVTANNALTSGNLAIASGNAAIVLGINALASGNLAIASGNAGIAQGLAGVRTLTGGSGMFVTPVGGSGFVTVHSSGVSPTAGSGLVGGGTNVFGYRFDVALAAAPSGLIFVSNKLGLDGSAQASGNAGIAQALAGVTRLVAGNNITLSPTGGSGVVTITSAGSAVGSGVEKVFFENQTVISGSYTITSGFNAGSFGPVTLVSGVVITVPSGSVWTVV